jgi:hypothetical protein
MIIGSYEDRLGAVPGLKLMVLSMARAMPEVTIDLTCPRIADAFKTWLVTTGLKNVRVRSNREWWGEGWSVKPGKIFELLDEGHEEVLWIDTDIVAHADFRPLLRGLAPDTLVVGEEFRARRPFWTRERTVGWGLEFVRELAHAMNLGFIRLTPVHRPLLARWRALQATPEFQKAMSMPVAERPHIMVTDQDVLTALLGSTEFAHVPVHYLKCGREIIQNSGANGYHVLERLANVGRGLPPLIHMLGREKPWDFRTVPSLRRHARDYMELAAIELSPYVSVGRRYKRELGEPSPWLDIRTALGKVFSWSCLGHPSLQGLPLAIVAQCLSPFRKPGV